MKISDLIIELLHYPQDCEVLAFNGDEMDTVEVTGLLYDPTHKTIELCTDIP